jgi:trans-2,3-dihydro-3-hydroxyanthranilate isomerase
VNRTVEILEYNAFTDQPFAGNPAGVVLDGSGLKPELMQRIARQMNLAETAFLVPPTSPDVDIRLRWFTPAIEVDLCGHATIATFAAAADHGVFPVNEGAERVLRVETLSGVLRIRITREQGQPRVAMQIPVPAFQPLDLDRDGFASLWGIEANALSGDWLRHEELNYWYLPVAGQDALRALTLDAERLSKIDDTAAFAFYTTESVDTDSHWHLRFFAPFHGVAEDIVTGSAQGPMGVVYQNQIEGAAADGWSEYKGEQGDSLGRPGRVRVRVQRENGAVGNVEIAGGAVPMLEGQISV